jgi:hypothetical protein
VFAAIIRAINVLLVKAANTSETSVNSYQATRRNNSEDRHLRYTGLIKSTEYRPMSYLYSPTLRENGASSSKLLSWRSTYSKDSQMLWTEHSSENKKFMLRFMFQFRRRLSRLKLFVVFLCSSRETQW